MLDTSDEKGSVVCNISLLGRTRCRHREVETIWLEHKSAQVSASQRKSALGQFGRVVVTVNMLSLNDLCRRESQ